MSDFLPEGKNKRKSPPQTFQVVNQTRLSQVMESLSWQYCPYDLQVILNIMKYAVPASGVTLKDLLRANFCGKKLPRRESVHPTHAGMSRTDMQAEIDARKRQAARQQIREIASSKKGSDDFRMDAVKGLMHFAKTLPNSEFSMLMENFDTIIKDDTIMRLFEIAELGFENESYSISVSGKDANLIAKMLLEKRLA